MKKITAIIISVLMCTLVFTACSKKTSDVDTEINRHLVGAWASNSSSNNYIDDDGVMHFEIFYFTGSKITCSLGTTEEMMTGEPIDYEITNGKLKVTLNGITQYAKLEFFEGGMNWVTDDSVIEYTKIPDEALADLPLTFELDPEFAAADVSESETVSNDTTADISTAE